MAVIPYGMLSGSTVSDLVSKYLGHSVEIIKSVLRVYYLRHYGESLDYCLFLFESTQVELNMVQKILLNCVTVYYLDLRDLISGVYGRDSGELTIYDCYRDLYDTRDAWCTNELYETVPEVPDVNLIKAMGWEEEFFKMMEYDGDLMFDLMQLLKIIESTKAGIRPVSELGDDGVYFGLYFDQNVGMFEPDEDNVCYYPIVDMDLSEQLEDGWAYYDCDRDDAVCYRVCHDYRDNKNAWYVVIWVRNSVFRIDRGVVVKVV